MWSICITAASVVEYGYQVLRMSKRLVYHNLLMFNVWSENHVRNVY